MQFFRNIYSSIFQLLILSLLVTASSLVFATTIDELLDAAIHGDHRDQANTQRDQYRHPKETLQFLGLQPEMTVVEIWPGRGWYSEILAPVVRHKGILYIAGFGTTADRTPDWQKGMHKEFMEKLESRPDVYDHVVVTELSVPERTTIAPPGSVDMVLTFRNVHNWMKGGYAEEMFNVFARTLKSGGILGIVEHRAKPGTTIEDMIKSGYVTEDYIIKLAEQTGFEFIAKSEINANPSDDTVHPKGVWTLPPTLRLCKNMNNEDEKNKCFAKYRSIGESDRMTLKFRKL